MYKKITHNITEEHFAHPIAAELKKKVDKIKATATIDYKGRVIDPVTGKPAIDPRTGDFVYADTNVSKAKATIMITPATQLHMHSHEFFGKLLWGIRNYITSELSGADDKEYILSRLLNDIKEFSTILGTYYPKKVGDDAVNHLTQFANVLSELVTSAKAGKDITKLTISGFGHLDDLANTISVANPTHWPETVVKEFLHTYFTHVIEQVTARIKKDWNADMIASTKASNVLTSGPVSEGILKGMPDFSTVFAEGIIKQYPQAFAIK